MHRWTDDTERLAREILEYVRTRARLDPVPLDGPRSPEELRRDAGATVTEAGIGGSEALRCSARCSRRPASRSTIRASSRSSRRRPTEAALLFDLVVGASSIYGGSWLEGSGAVFAENQALRWLADLAGLPEGAGGVFVQGGTLGNLSALVAARDAARSRRRGAARALEGRLHGATRTRRSTTPRGSWTSTSSRAVDDRGRLTGADLRATLERPTRRRLRRRRDGRHDELRHRRRPRGDRRRSAASTACWLHVDGAYGGAALAAPSVRQLFAGIEHADSFIVDPHKWLFAPFDCCALLYREPALARAAHTPDAGYLDVLRGRRVEPVGLRAQPDAARARAAVLVLARDPRHARLLRGDRDARSTVARYAAAEIERRDYVELLREPDLSVVVFRRIGWTAARLRRLVAPAARRELRVRRRRRVHAARR